MALDTTPYKGVRDFYPQDYIVRQYIFDTWRNTVEKFGYEPYDASVIEGIDIYLAKTSEEIVSEQTYSFTDRGGRQVVLRPEMTPTVSRMVAQRRQELAYPLRWYSIPNCWRYERPQKGRLREHWQLNVDVFGIQNVTADIEIITVANEIMKAFKATPEMYTIRVNSRQVVAYILSDYLGLEAAEATTIIRLIDRMNKMEYGEFAGLISAAISPSLREEKAVDEQLLTILKARTIKELPTEVQRQPFTIELQELLENLKSQGVQNAVFDPTLMRGFMYYTDVVFEVFDTSPENNRALFGGGRYDGLVGQFGVEPVPTVGFGMGDVTIKDFLETHKLLPKLAHTVHATMVFVGDMNQKAQPLLAKLRQEGAHISVDSTDRKLDKKLKSVAKSGVRYAIIFGEGESNESNITIKDLSNGKQEQHSFERVVTTIMANRKNNLLD